MYSGALVERRSYGPVQPILQIEGPLVLHHVGKQVAKESGVLGKERFKVQGPLGGHKFIQPDGTGRKGRPVFGGTETMVGVRASLAHSFEYHSASVSNWPVLGNVESARRGRL